MVELQFWIGQITDIITSVWIMLTYLAILFVVSIDASLLLDDTVLFLFTSTKIVAIIFFFYLQHASENCEFNSIFEQAKHKNKKGLDLDIRFQHPRLELSIELFLSVYVTIKNHHVFHHAE